MGSINNIKCRWICAGISLYCAIVWAVDPITFNTHAFSTNDPVDSLAAENAFISVITNGGFTTFSEDFEDAVWNSTRSPAAAANIMSRGIVWNSSAGNMLRTYGDSDSYEVPPPYMVFTYDPSSGFHSVPNTIIGISSQKLYAIGMWMDGTGTKGKIKVIFDDGPEVKFQRITGYEPADPPDPPEPIKETARLTYSKEFFGVYVPDGFNKFQILEFAGEFDEVVLMWARTFTFAIEPPLHIDISNMHYGSENIELEMITSMTPSNLTVQSSGNLLDTNSWQDIMVPPVLISKNLYRAITSISGESNRTFRVIGTK